MTTVAELKLIARERLADANALFLAKRYDGAIYLAGYAVEIALKRRISMTLGWPGYPETKGEFQKYQSFRIHELDVLLHLSGREKKIKNAFFAEWSGVATWDPGARYKQTGTASRSDADLMLLSASKLLKVL